MPTASQHCGRSSPYLVGTDFIKDLPTALSLWFPEFTARGWSHTPIKQENHDIHHSFLFFPFFAAFAATCSENTFKRFISFSYCAVSMCEYLIGNLNAFVSFLSRL